MKFIDIHTHRSSLENGVISIFNLFINESEKLNKLESSVSVSFHPWFIDEQSIPEIIDVIPTFLNNNCLAIGECGLDNVKNQNFAIQLEVFEKLIQISEEVKKPMIIHCVKAFNEMIKLRTDNHCKQSWVFHRFSGSKQIAEQLIQQNCYLSFGEHLISNIKLQRLFIDIPMNSIFFETDDSDISISKIYQKAAELKQISKEEMKRIVFNNYMNLFPDADRK